MKIKSEKQLELINTSLLSVLNRINLEELNNKKIFITGGTGFFGGWLLRSIDLLNKKNKNIEIVVLSRDPEKFLLQNPDLANKKWLRFCQGNVRDFRYPAQEDFDLVIHGATETSMAAHANPENMFDDILLGSRRVLDFSNSCRAKRILLISSGAVYGPQPSDVTHQADASQLACSTLLPSSAYGEGKRVMELLAAINHQSSGLEYVIARCFAFCGPLLPLDAHFAIGNFIRDALGGQEIIVQGDGSAMRSYLFGADLAVWLLFLLTNGSPGQSYNVGSDHALSIKELAIQVRDLLSPGKPVKILGSQGEEQLTRHRYVPQIEMARRLGCSPWTSLKESIAITGDYWRQ